MILPNLAFDALLFGLLLLAAAIDSAFPVTHGAATLLVAGGATYWAAQELSEWLLRRVGWSQESLLTSVSLCVAGFVYFWFRNQSDLALLVLSIGLMMGSLMLAISVLAAGGAVLREGRGTALAGWLAGAILSLVLGLAVGFVILVLGQEGMASLPLKAGGLAGALVLWKLRESLAPPAVNAHYTPAASQTSQELAAPAAPRVALFPQRGTLLDRLVPILILGLISLVAARGLISLDMPSTPALAAPNATATPTTTADANATNGR